jgi:cytochrome c oxidase subunit 2
MHLPVGKPAIVHLKSKDVIHCFNIPNMVIKQDMIPGQSIPIWFTPTVTTQSLREQLGREDYDYQLACAQLCGNGHSSMRGFVTVETQEEFDTWINAQEPALGEASEADAFWQ